MGLFSTTTHHHTVAPAYPTTVHEHRAPTDASVRMLKEMQDAARNEVEASVAKINDAIVATVFEYPSDQSVCIHFAVGHTTVRVPINRLDMLMAVDSFRSGQHLNHKVRKGFRVIPDLKGRKVQPALRVHKVTPARKVHRGSRDRLVLKDHKARRGHKVPPDRTVPMRCGR